MRYFSSPEAPCLAICPTCAGSDGEAWQDWQELDPERLEGAQPTQCAHCGAETDL